MSGGPVEFGDGSEPWSVLRGGVKHWLHCMVRDVGALPDGQRAELGEWLAARGLDDSASSLVVIRADGYRVHAASSSADVTLEDLPAWLQRPAPAKPPARTPKARK